MSEEKMLDAVQAALDDHGIDDRVEAVGQFNPRGHTGGGFAGGLIGGDVGAWPAAWATRWGPSAATSAGTRAADATSGLPAWMLVGVSAANVYGFAGRSRSAEPTDLVFQVPRDRIEVKVHQRVNVRVLELIDESTGSRIELRGQPAAAHALEGRDRPPEGLRGPCAGSNAGFWLQSNHRTGLPGRKTHRRVTALSSRRPFTCCRS